MVHRFNVGEGVFADMWAERTPRGEGKDEGEDCTYIMRVRDPSGGGRLDLSLQKAAVIARAHSRSQSLYPTVLGREGTLTLANLVSELSRNIEMSDIRPEGYRGVPDLPPVSPPNLADIKRLLSTRGV